MKNNLCQILENKMGIISKLWEVILKKQRINDLKFDQE